MRWQVLNTFIVTYDIADPKRLRQVFKTMKNWGNHIQFSVFECQLTKVDILECQSQLQDIINNAHDQILFIDIGPTNGRGDRVVKALGKPYHEIDSSSTIV